MKELNRKLYVPGGYSDISDLETRVHLDKDRVSQMEKKPQSGGRESRLAFCLVRFCFNFRFEEQLQQEQSHISQADGCSGPRNRAEGPAPELWREALALGGG